MTWAAVAVGVAGAGATAYGASQQSKAASASPLTRGQRGISDKVGQYFLGQMHPFTDHLGRMRMGLSGATPYEGDFLGPLLPGYEKVLGLLGNYTPATMSRGQQNQWASLFSGQPSYQAKLDPTTTAGYFQQAVTNPMMHTFQSSILPQIKEGFAGVGAFSSRQGQAQQQGLSDLQSNLTGQLGQFQLANQQMQEQLNSQLAESAQQRALQSLTAFGQQQLQYANQPLLAAGAQSDVLGGLQKRLDTGQAMQYQDFLRTTPENNPILQLMMQYMGMPQKNTVVPPNMISQGIQGAGGGIGLWQALANQGQQNNQNNFSNLNQNNPNISWGG